MIYLAGSIILTSYLTLSFKVVEKFRINTFQVIVFNYIACVLTGSFVNGSFPIKRSTFDQDWIAWACVLGATFIILFNVIAFTAQRIGVAVASVANKLSLVIPFLFSLYLYNERASLLKIAGIVVALLAVVLTCLNQNPGNGMTNKKFKVLTVLVPALLFIGSGLLDTMVKYVEQKYLDETNKNFFLITAFSAAGSIGIVIMLFQGLIKQNKFSWKSLVAGFAIGIPNYFSIWCLLRVLKNYQDNSSAIIPINNMGIVLFSSLMAAMLFGEKLSVVNWMGIVLAIASIALIAYG